MKRFALWIPLLILFIIFLVGIGFLLSGKEKERSPLPELAKESPSQSSVSLSNFTKTIYRDDRILATVKADHFEIARRKFWIFGIKDLNEISFSNLHIAAYLYDRDPSDVDFYSLTEKTLAGLGMGAPLFNRKGRPLSKEVGLITRARIKGLTIEIFRNGKLVLSVRARGANLDPGKAEASMVNCIVEDAQAGMLIWGKTVIWKNKGKTFNIPREYIVTTPEGKRRGRGMTANIDSDFAVTISKRRSKSAAPGE